MDYPTAAKQHATAHPFQVERWSTATERWVHVADAKSERDAARIVAMRKVIDPESEYRTVPA